MQSDHQTCAMDHAHGKCAEDKNDRIPFKNLKSVNCKVRKADRQIKNAMRSSDMSHGHVDGKGEIGRALRNHKADDNQSHKLNITAQPLTS